MCVKIIALNMHWIEFYDNNVTFLVGNEFELVLNGMHKTLVNLIQRRTHGLCAQVHDPCAYSVIGCSLKIQQVR